jgi:glycosyltransferase involved in cell wall biosynthesis
MLGNRKCCEKLLCVKENPLHCVINLCKQDKLIPSVIVALEHLFNKACGFHDSIDAYICQSEAMLELAAESGISRDKLFLLNTFIPDEDFAKRPVYENNSYFLYIGRISKEKGIDIFINAMKSLPEIPVHIIGTGPEEEYYKEFVRKNNLHNIKFMGYKSGQELEEEYTNCIATVLPCVWFENFPRSILESFAYGKPAIATKIGGIQEIIDQGLNGFTFDVGNAEMLAKYIKQMFYNKEFSEILGQNARQKAEKKYNSKVYSERVMEIYNTVLNTVSPAYQAEEGADVLGIEV